MSPAPPITACKATTNWPSSIPDSIIDDNGVLVNSGEIIGLGDDGVQQEQNANVANTATGYIEGAIGINTAPLDLQGQTVVNSGPIIGRSGTALSLGAGDDTLEPAGGRIVGNVDMGAGIDALRVIDAAPGLIRFTSAPETVDMTGTPAFALHADQMLAVTAPMAFAAAEGLPAQMSMGLSHGVLRPMAGTGFWTAGQGRIADGLHRIKGDYAVIGLRAAQALGPHVMLQATIAPIRPRPA